jgi:hypothetical protein
MLISLFFHILDIPLSIHLCEDLEIRDILLAGKYFHAHDVTRGK